MRRSGLGRVLVHCLAHPPARVGPERRVERRVVSIEGAQEPGDALLGELAWPGWACGRDGARELLDAGEERGHEPVARRAWTVPGGQQEFLVNGLRGVLAG